MEVKTMNVQEREIKLYRCHQCLFIQTWVSDPENHQQWHKLREETDREIERVVTIAARSANN